MKPASFASACLDTPDFKRRSLIQALAGAGVMALAPWQAFSATDLLVPNVTGLYSVEVARVIVPSATEEVVHAVRTWPGKIAVGGGRYSMGGQVAIRGGLHLDMRRMTQPVWFEPQRRRVRVQAGMRWRDLQDLIDPYDLAVQTMQSYANFTVGGSVAVNAHGRYVGNGPVGNSVKALQLVLADGSIAEASPHDNFALFRAVLGGYGAIAVITEVELELAENAVIERMVEKVPLDEYPAYFEKTVRSDKNCILHNADLIPPHFDVPVAVSWRKSGKVPTEPARLVPRGQSYAMEQNVLWALTELPGGRKVQGSIVHPLLSSKPVVKWRNHEASLDVAELEPRTRAISTYVLQEYFVPVRYCVSFARELGQILHTRKVMALNVSIRHSPADQLSLLPWAVEDVFSFVLYYKQRTGTHAQTEVGRWTRELIDLVLKYQGRYYLPYQLHATREQFDLAYPEAEQLRALKREVDPTGKFSNELWAKYL